jgi:hypothetical protein
MSHSSPLNSNAIATVIIEGLAIACHNSTTNKWQVGFLRKDSHFPRIKIFQLDSANNEISTLTTYDLAAGDKVFITVNNPVAPANWKYETFQLFNRQSTTNMKDLRWMLDMEGTELHDSSVSWQNGTFGTNYLEIENSIFYTAKVTTDSYQKQRVDQSGTAQPETLGRIGRAIGADLECDSGGSIVITIQSEKKRIITLAPQTGVRYEIFFDNTCYDGISQPTSSDFQHYYDKIVDSPLKFNMIASSISVEVGVKNPGCTSIVAGKTDDLPTIFKG